MRLDRRMLDLLEAVGRAMTLQRRSVEAEIRTEQEKFFEAFSSRGTEGPDPSKHLAAAVSFQVEHLERFAGRYLKIFQRVLEENDVPVSGEVYRHFWTTEFRHFVADRVKKASRTIEQLGARLAGSAWDDKATLFRAELLHRQSNWEHKIASLANDADLLHAVEVKKKRHMAIKRLRGRPPLRSNAFVLEAGTLFLNAKGAKQSVHFEDLLEIADSLDASGYSPREEECGLSEIVRDAISAFNSRQGSSRTAHRLFTFVDLLNQRRIPFATGPEMPAGPSGFKPACVKKTINLVVKIRTLFRRCAADVKAALAESDRAINGTFIE
jgi:hypothetical protein